MNKKRKLTLTDAGIAFLVGFVLSQLLAVIGVSIINQIMSSLGKTEAQIKLFFDGIWGILIQTILMDIGFILIFIYYYRKGLNKQSTFAKPTNNNWQYFGICLLIGVFTLFALAGTLNYFELLVEKLGKSASSLSYEMDSLWKYIVSLISLAVLPAICEELLFRGVIVNCLKQKGYMFAIFMSSIMFAIFHFSLSQLIYPFCFGIILSVVYLKTKNLLFPILLHFANNALSVSLQYFTSPSTASTFTHSSVMLVYAIITLIIWIYVIHKLILHFKQSEVKSLTSNINENSNFQSNTSQPSVTNNTTQSTNIQIGPHKTNNTSIFYICLGIMIVLYILLILIG